MIDRFSQLRQIISCYRSSSLFIFHLKIINTIVFGPSLNYILRMDHIIIFDYERGSIHC